MLDEILNRFGHGIQKSDTLGETFNRPEVGQNAKSVVEAWQKRQSCLCLNTNVAKSPQKRVGSESVQSVHVTSRAEGSYIVDE